MEIPHIGDYLSLAGLLLTMVGFVVTIAAALKAKDAAEAARDAANAATQELTRFDMIEEIAAALQLIEEIKRLHRSSAVELLPDRYSGLRLKVISIREGLSCPDDSIRALLQDVVQRVAGLEKALDQNSSIMTDKRYLARSNASLSLCSEAVIKVKEGIRSGALVRL